MDSTYTYPKLRMPLDIRLQQVGDQHALVLQCPTGISERPLLLVPAVAPVLQLFQGALSAEDILQRFEKDGLTRDVLWQLIKLLDEHLFLANARFFAAEQGAKDLFHSSPVREPALAGLSYPLAANELKKLVDGYLVPLPEGHCDSVREPLCLISPHIDYRRGGSCYGVTYPHLAQSRADLFIVMGTAHKYSKHTFHLTAKDFACPMGAFPCDMDFVAQVANRYGIKRSFADEFLHKQEHSLELQLPFLHAVKPSATIAPILVGSFYDMLAAQQYPHECEEYESFVGALVEGIRSRYRDGKRICFIAGVDMAHVGRQFGDEKPLTPETMAHVALRDEQYLGALRAGDKKALFRHVCEDQDARRICGFPTMYTILDVLERLQLSYSCEVFSYDQAVDYTSDCAVTFAGAALFKELEALGS